MKPRLKANNRFNVDHAYPGICSLCFTEIAVFDEDNRPKFMKTNYRRAEVTLDDGSRMGVTLCDECHKYLSPQDLGELMENEINGWQKEVDSIPHWTDEKKKEHMNGYSKRFITVRNDMPMGIEEAVMIPRPRKAKLRIKT